MSRRRFFDVTLPVQNGMVTWPSDDPVRVRAVRSMDRGDRLNQSMLEMSAHTGTHIDAPVHFVAGAAGIDDISLDVLMGPAEVVVMEGVRAIGPDILSAAAVPPGTKRLLLKTDNSRLLGENSFVEDYAHLTPDGARWVVDRGAVLLGMDYLSVAQFGSGEEVHGILLGAGIVVVEGLDLRRVQAGSYELIALPLKITGCDGSPARVVLSRVGDG